MIKNFILSVVSLLLISCSGQNDAENVLRVGISADNPPFEFVENNEIIGLDKDIIDAIALQMGKTVEVHNMDFHALLPSLQNHKIDLVISGVTPTELRKEHFSFSQPYFVSKVVIVTKQNNGINNLDGIQNKMVAVQTGTIFDDIANNVLSKDLTFSVKNLSNFLIMVEELNQSHVDAILTEEVQAKELLKKYPEFKIVEIPTLKELSTYCIVMPKNSEYLNPINKIILSMSKTDELKQIKQRWLSR
jgi:polar amino acid transport system substrate-binding protein